MENGDQDFLQTWYSSQCDGDWEHQFGIQIGTLDNPGWSLTIDLVETDLEGRLLNRQMVEWSEQDWCQSWSDGRKFSAAAGARNLGEAIEAFRAFVESAA